MSLMEAERTRATKLSHGRRVEMQTCCSLFMTIVLLLFCIQLLKFGVNRRVFRHSLCLGHPHNMQLCLSSLAAFAICKINHGLNIVFLFLFTSTNARICICRNYKCVYKYNIVF